MLPISFCGGPDRVIKQISRRARRSGSGCSTCRWPIPDGGDNDAMMASLDLFGRGAAAGFRRSERADLLLPLMPLRRGRASRRRLLSAAMAAGARPLPHGRPGGRARQLSQEEADYRDRPKSGLSCAACALFRPPRACVVVAGDISPNGWCKFFDLPD